MPKTNKSSDDSALKQEWSTLHFRLTAFLSPKYPMDFSKSWWQEVAGELPDSQQANPKIGQRIETGPFGEAFLVLETQLGRIDLRLTSLNPSDPFPTSPAAFRPMSSSLQAFMDVAHRWLKVAPPIIRLAFGAQLGIPVDDRIAGYKTLAGFLPSINIDAEHSSEFLYQINRPVTSSVILDLKINRLSKWAVTAFTTANFNISNESPTIMATPQRMFASFLELDINTAGTRTEEFELNQLQPQFDELAKLGVQIASEGDVA